MKNKKVKSLICVNDARHKRSVLRHRFPEAVREGDIKNKITSEQFNKILFKIKKKTIKGKCN